MCAHSLDERTCEKHIFCFYSPVFLFVFTFCEDCLALGREEFAVPGDGRKAEKMKMRHTSRTERQRDGAREERERERERERRERERERE